MGAWVYCENCGDGMDYPTRHQALRNDYTCERCGTVNDCRVDPMELVCEELDRLESRLDGQQDEPVSAPTGEEVKALREKTGKGMQECHAILMRERLDQAIQSMSVDGNLKWVLRELVRKDFPSTHGASEFLRDVSEQVSRQ